MVGGAGIAAAARPGFKDVLLVLHLELIEAQAAVTRRVTKPQACSQSRRICLASDIGFLLSRLCRVHLSRTKDPEMADFFFVPAYSICMFEGQGQGPG